ncbi:uncharacterized protein LOC141674979 [Apium graveolens]|uniref:uncharacterized protein LOC141674979 n=1 Tax=Apium graveolens TaxID=4045 RepID=UPI003D7A5FC9
MADTGDRGGGSAGDGSQNDQRRRGLRYTAQQIQRLEGAFNECRHPDGNTRMELSRELGLSLEQIKIWYENRRAKLQAQLERAENLALRTENEKIRSENIAIIETLKNAVCQSCREQKLREENAQLREQAINNSQSNVILQESCFDSSGALVVYCPLDLPTINSAMSREDPSFIPVLSSGFAISPDAGENPGAREMSAGSLVTIVVKLVVSNMTPGDEMSQESVDTVNNLVGNTIKQIKAALSCSTSED